MTLPIESPCINICVIDPATRLCKGCLRSIDEISRWGSMTPDARRRVISELPARTASQLRSHGG
jgi:predicted Fe-S protein YdhL (DUF1289 family)